MIDYGERKSTAKPEPIVLDESSVWVYTNIQAVEEVVDERVFKGYVFDMVQYTKDEYIRRLDTQLTDTQLALVEVYEIIIV